MIGIVGGGLAAAKLVEGYRGAGGDEEITIWSQDPHGPYHRPPLSKRLLRGESEPGDALVASGRLVRRARRRPSARRDGRSLDDVTAETIVIATGRGRGRCRAEPFRRIDDSLALRERAETAQDRSRHRRRLHRLRDHRLPDLRWRSGDPDRPRPMVFASLQAPPLSEALRASTASGAWTCAWSTSEIPEADMTVGGIGVGYPECRARPRTPASRCGAGSWSTSGSRPRGPGVYAIGDVAEFYDPVFGRLPPDRALVERGVPRHHARPHPGRHEMTGTTSSPRSSPRSSDVASSTSAMPQGHDSTTLEGDFARGEGDLSASYAVGR